MCDLKSYTYKRRRNKLLDEALLQEREDLIQAKIKRRELRKQKKRLRDNCYFLITSFTVGLCVVGMYLQHAHATPLPVITKMEVFTTNQYPVSPTSLLGAQITIYNLDQLQQSIAKVNQELQSMGQVEAEIGAKNWLMGQIPLLHDEFKGITLAQQYGIQQLPAIVFDEGEAETIGVTDLNAALLDYQAWSASHE